MRDLSNKQYEWLLAEISRWQEEGKLSPEQAQAIRGDYRPKIWTAQLLAMYLVAVLLLGAGLMAIIGHNWDQFSPALRLTVAFALLLPSGAYLYWSVDKNNLQRELSNVIFCTAVGLFLIICGQVLQSQSRLSDFLLLWLLVCLPNLFIYRSKALAIMLQVLQLAMAFDRLGLIYVAPGWLLLAATFYLRLQNRYLLPAYVGGLLLLTCDWLHVPREYLPLLPLLLALAYPLSCRYRWPDSYRYYGVIYGYIFIITQIIDVQLHPVFGLGALAVCLVCLPKDLPRLLFAALPALTALIYNDISVELRCLIAIVVLALFAYQAISEQRLAKMNFAVIHVLLLGGFLAFNHDSMLSGGLTLLVAGTVLLAANIYLLRNRKHEN